MTTKNKAICWSKFPREVYSIPFNGGLEGIGKHPIFDVVPGAWNLLTLMWSNELEALIPWAGDPDQYPFDCGIIPYAVGSALQRYSPGISLGQLAGGSTPADFLGFLKEWEFQKYVIMIDAFGDEFWKRAEAFALSWEPQVSNNVIRGNFGQAKIQ